MSMFYDFNDKRHEIKSGEIKAIERSGRPHDWRQYIVEQQPAEPPRRDWPMFVNSSREDQKRS